MGDVRHDELDLDLVDSDCRSALFGDARAMEGRLALSGQLRHLHVSQYDLCDN